MVHIFVPRLHPFTNLATDEWSCRAHIGRRRLVTEKPLLDVPHRKALKFARKSGPVERMSLRREHLVESFQMEFVGIGHRAVDIE